MSQAEIFCIVSKTLRCGVASYRLGTDPQMRDSLTNEGHFFLYKINTFLVENFRSKAH